MQGRRIFIAINLPKDIKEELFNFQKKFEWEGSQWWAKWTKKDNLHITLEFLGYVNEKDLPAIFKKTEEFASKTPAFTINLDKINYFPDSNSPKYIFATGGKYHVTLARVREWEWKKINPDDRPDIKEEIDLSFEVSSIEVMESFLKRGGPEYTALKSFRLLK
jgi:2'-5' RNA ligase